MSPLFLGNREYCQSAKDKKRCWHVQLRTRTYQPIHWQTQQQITRLRVFMWALQHISRGQTTRCYGMFCYRLSFTSAFLLCSTYTCPTSLQLFTVLPRLLFLLDLSAVCFLSFIFLEQLLLILYLLSFLFLPSPLCLSFLSPLTFILHLLPTSAPYADQAFCTICRPGPLEWKWLLNPIEFPL